MAVIASNFDQHILGPILVEFTPVSLLLRLRRGPMAEDWNTLIELCTPLLLKWSKSVGLSDAAAADLVQDVFVVLIQQIPHFQYDAGRSFRSWLKTITLNKWRTSKRRMQPASLNGPDRVGDTISMNDPNEAFWEQEFTRELVLQAMQIARDRFESNTWEACRLMTCEGYSARQTAESLGITTAAAFKAKSRVLKTLREELAGFLD